MEITSLAGIPTLFVMAAEAEYGPHLRARIRPLMTGIGPVEAAVQLTMALTKLAHQGRLPKLIVSLGSAGARHLTQGRVYQASSVSWRDMDASPLGFEKGRTPLLDLPAEVPLHNAIADIPRARLSTGGNIVSGAAYEAIDADMVDMETWSHLRAAQAFGLPLIALRGISDGVSELQGMQDWTALLGVIDERLALALDVIDAKLDALTLVCP